MRIDVKTAGFKELEAALAEFEKAATRKAIARRALTKAAAPVQSAMQSRAPVLSGLLASSISVSTKLKGEAGKAAYAKAMRATAGNRAMATKALRDARRAAKGSMPPVVMFVGPSVAAPHAHLVEFGTKPHINGGMFKGSQHPGARPHPFVRPGWDASKAEALAGLTDVLRDEIMKAAARAAKRKAKAA